MGGNALTLKQQAFVREYQHDLNATQAAIRAGYSKKTARAQGARLLTNVDIRRVIQGEQEQFARNTGIRKEHLIERLRQIAFSSIADIVHWDGKTLTLKPSESLTKGQVAAIESVNILKTKAGDTLIRIKMHDRIRALPEISHMLGYYQDTRGDNTSALNLLICSGGKSKDGDPSASAVRQTSSSSY